MAFVQQGMVQVPVVRWYRVVAADQDGTDVRQSIQASNPDVALRLVMCSHSLRFTSDAFIWRLFSHAKPSRRCNVRCRVPVVRPS